MPELPEVETIRRQLLEKVCGKKITRAEVKYAGLLNVSAKEFVKAVEGAKITDIRRRAKLLIIYLSSGWSLLIHLKLTGQLICDGKSGLGQPHLIYHFSDGLTLKHYDFRKFGYVRLIKSQELEKYLEKEKLGPEPLDKNFTLEKFRQLMARKPKAKIKPLLMDQSFLAGIGNIYAQEACFYAKILPIRRAGNLSPGEVKYLHHGLRKILQDSIHCKGTSADAYVDAFGQEGDYFSHLKVYGRGGQKCRRCGTILKEAKLAGRGTVWCPKCQK